MCLKELTYDDFVDGNRFMRRKSRRELWAAYDSMRQSKEYWVRKALRLEKWRLECDKLIKEYHDDE